jgi:TrmH family RNA methyltransferase
VKTITSVANPRYRRLLKLMQSSRERRTAGLSLLDGVHLVGVYRERIGLPVEIAVSLSATRRKEVTALMASMAPLEPLVLSDALFAALSSVTTPTGIIAAVKTPRPPALPEAPGPCVMLEDIQDPGNLGSILRSTAAAGVREIYLSRHSVHAWSPRVLRAGMGAHFLLDIHEDIDLVALVSRCGGRVVAACGRTQPSIYNVDLTGTVALLFGNEGSGLSAALRRKAHVQAGIPMPGGVESLNVAAAAAVCLFERVRQAQRAPR